MSPDPKEWSHGLPLRGRFTHLRPLRTDDYEWLHFAMSDPRVAYRYRYRGGTSNPEQFVSQLWAGVLAQYMIVTPNDDKVGLVAVYNADLSDGTAYFAAFIDSDLQQKGWPFEAVAIFIDYVFTLWSLRWLYFEALEFNYDSIASGSGRFLQELGRLPGHAVVMGVETDLVIGGIKGTDWARMRAESPLAPLLDPVWKPRNRELR